MVVPACIKLLVCISSFVLCIMKHALLSKLCVLADLIFSLCSHDD
jgi:hypothetical protein